VSAPVSAGESAAQGGRGWPPGDSHQEGGLVAWRAGRQQAAAYRGTSLIRNNPPVGPYSRPMPRALWWS